MKKLILFFVMIFCSIAFPQKTFFQYLQNSVDSASAANYDTLTVFDLGRNYQFSNLIIENVGSVPCTLSVNGVAYLRSGASWTFKRPPAITDTVYSTIPIKVSAGTYATTFIVANGANTSYLIEKQYLEALRVYITQNAGGKVNLIVETGPAVK